MERRGPLGDDTQDTEPMAHSSGDSTVTRRLFVAALPDEGVRDELVAVQNMTLPHLDHARPTSRGNLHLTLAFLGELDREREARTLEAMRRAAENVRTEEFAVELGPVGCFQKRRGSILWQGLREDGTEGREHEGSRDGMRRLAELRATLGMQLLEGGAIPEPLPPFVPHMTLARGCRLRKEEREAGMDAFLAQANEQLVARSLSAGRPGAAKMHVGAMSLMWSHHPDGGALTYTEVARVSL